MSQTSVIYHPKFVTHGNAVLRERLLLAYNFLVDFLKKKDPNRVFIQRPEMVEEELILQIHTKQHLNRVKEDDCYEAALLSAGGAVLAGEMVWTGKVKNSFVFTGTAGQNPNEFPKPYSSLEQCLPFHEIAVPSPVKYSSYHLKNNLLNLIERSKFKLTYQSF